MKKLLIILFGLLSLAYAQTCPPVTSPMASSVGPTSARTSWTAAAGSIIYQYTLYKMPSRTFVTSGSGTATYKDWVGLSAVTTYRAVITNICVSGTPTNASAPDSVSFTTLSDGINYTPLGNTKVPYFKIDSNLLILCGDTTIGRAPNVMGQVKMRCADSLFYYYNGRRWKNLSIDSLGIVSQLNNKVDSVTIVGSLLYYWKQGVGYGAPLPAGTDTAFVLQQISDSLAAARVTITNADNAHDTLLTDVAHDTIGIKTLTAGWGQINTPGATTITQGPDSNLVATRLQVQHRIDSLAAKDQYGTFFNMSAPTVFPPDLFAPSTFYYVSGGGINFTGSTGYWDHYIKTDSSSASNNFTVSTEFTLGTKPAASSEGIFIGRNSDNSTNREDLFARAVYSDATHWSVEIWANYAFTTPTLLASVPFAQTVPMTNGQKYRLELSFSNPFVQASLALIDSTKAQYKDITNIVTATYKYLTPLSTINMPNTGGYSFGALGTTNVYHVTNFNASLNDQKHCDVVVIGNSISQDYNATSPDNGYVARLFQNTGLTYAKLAGQGDKTAEALLRRAEYLNFKSKWALIELGWNDYLQSVPNATFEANLTLIINDLKSNGTTPILVKFINNTAYDTSFYRVAAATGVQLIDVGYQLVGFLDVFNIHPDDYGCEIAANIIRTKAPEIFGFTHSSAYPKPNQYLSKTISGNTTWDGATAIYNIDASAGNVQLNFGSYGADLIGRDIWINKIDATTNTAKAAFFSGSSVNGGAGSIQINTPWKSMHIVCTGVNEFVADTGYYAAASTTVPLSGITAANATNTIDNLDKAQVWNWSTLVSSALIINSTSTNLVNGGEVVTIATSGANSASSSETTTLRIQNNRTGTTSTNVGMKLLATGGTNNYALIVPVSSGSVGIGNSAPTSILDVTGTTKSTQFASTYQTLTDASTITWNANSGSNATVTLGATGRTLSITNPVTGTFYMVQIVQDGGGSKTITTWPTGTKWPGGVAPTLTTAAGAVDIVTFFYDGTNFKGTYQYDFK